MEIAPEFLASKLHINFFKCKNIENKRILSHSVHNCRIPRLHFPIQFSAPISPNESLCSLSPSIFALTHRPYESMNRRHYSVAVTPFSLDRCLRFYNLEKYICDCFSPADPFRYVVVDFVVLFACFWKWPIFHTRFQYIHTQEAHGGTMMCQRGEKYQTHTTPANKPPRIHPSCPVPFVWKRKERETV